MKNCTKCGALIDDYAVACPQCGATQEQVQPSVSYTPDGAAALSQMSRFLKLERIGWKVVGIICLVAAIVMAVTGLIMIAVGAGVSAGLEDTRESVGFLVGFGVAGLYYLIIGLIALLPAGIVGLIMAPKVEYYMNKVYTDVSIPRKRCSSIGMIIFCLLFNEIAAIFFIINFVKTRAKNATFDQIEAVQRSRG